MNLILGHNQSKFVRLSLKKLLPVIARSISPIKTCNSLEVLIDKLVLQLVEVLFYSKNLFKSKWSQPK